MLARCVVLLAVSAIAAAQNHPTEYQIDPNSVDPQQRAEWCLSERSVCPQICGGPAYPNTCDAETLQYACVCSNHNKPNISNYAGTLESEVCTEWVTQCAEAHTTNKTAQNICYSVKCGKAPPASAAPTKSSGGGGGGGSSSTTSHHSYPTGSNSSGPGKGPSGSHTAGGHAPTGSSGAALLHAASSYGTPALAAAALAFFGFAL